MRNLKRALSLALAAAMLISLMVVGASAKSYGDQDQVSQIEAVQLLTDLGIVGGDQNGNYQPTATLTRAEFTVMMSNLLNGSKFDPTLFNGTDTPFTDIQGHWAASYIAYCYSAGVIAGTSATTFSPDSTLTAAQAAAILLSALGYNKNGEFAENGQFSLNVTAIAQREGLYEDLSVGANSGVSRENVAQMIKNALFMNTQEYLATLEIYQDESPLATTLFNGLYAVEGVLTNYGTTSQTTINNGVVRVESFAEDVGTPVVYYRDRDGLVSTAAVSAQKDVVLGTGYGEATLAEMSDRNDDNFIARADTAVTYVYQNGVTTRTAIDAAAATLLGAGDIDDLTGTLGVITQLIDNDSNGRYDVVKITVKSVDVVDGDVRTQANGADTLVIVPGVAGLTGATAANTTETVHGYEGLVDGDVVLYYQDVNNNWYLEEAQSFTGVMTASTANTGDSATSSPRTYTVGGVAYESARLNGAINYQTNAATYAEELVDFRMDSAATFYLDNGGHIVWAEGEAAPLQIVLVLKNDDYNPGNVFDGSTIQSQVIFGQTGNTEIITVSGVSNNGAAVTDPDNTSNYPAQQDNDALDNTYGDNVGRTNKTDVLYTYQITDDGYELTQLTGSSVMTLSPNRNNEHSIVSGIPSSFQTAYGDRVITDSQTVFLVRNTASGSNAPYADTYTVYTGYTSVPSMDIQQNGAVLYRGSDGIADYVFVNDYVLTGAPANDDIYVLAEDVTAVYKNDGTVDHFTVNAIVDGVKTTVNLANGAEVETFTGGVGSTETLSSANNPLKDHTLYVIDSYDRNGYVDEMSEATSSASGAGTYYWVGIVGSEAARNGIVILGGEAGSSLTRTSFAYASDAVVYTISARGDIVTTGGINSLTTDDDDLISVVVAGSEYGTADNNTIVELYVYQQDSIIGGGGGGGGATPIPLDPATHINNITVNGASIGAPANAYANLADAVANAYRLDLSLLSADVNGRYNVAVTEGTGSQVIRADLYMNAISVPTTISTLAADSSTISNAVLTPGNVIVITAANAGNTTGSWYVAYLVV